MTWWFDMHTYWEMISTIRSEINYSLKSSPAATMCSSAPRGRHGDKLWMMLPFFLQRNYKTWRKEKRIQTPTWARPFLSVNGFSEEQRGLKPVANRTKFLLNTKGLFVKAMPKPHCYKWGSASAFTTNTVNRGLLRICKYLKTGKSTHSLNPHGWLADSSQKPIWRTSTSRARKNPLATDTAHFSTKWGATANFLRMKTTQKNHFLLLRSATCSLIQLRLCVPLVLILITLFSSPGSCNKM